LTKHRKSTESGRNELGGDRVILVLVFVVQAFSLQFCFSFSFAAIGLWRCLFYLHLWADFSSGSYLHVHNSSYY